jgi:imidazolonepropionase-like amidohydrolase
MRKLRSPALSAAHSLSAALLLAALPSLRSQEPSPEGPPVEAAPATRPDDRGNRPRRPRQGQTLVLEAGMVHPVSAPAIENGVVVIRGERIVAVGRKGEVELPPNATVRSFPTGHVYPGLVDALTDAYTDGSLRGDGSSDGGAAFVDDLRPQDPRRDALVAAGITTAYVTVRSPALVRGQGAVVRPRKDGFEPWAGKERAALQLRLTEGPAPSHALQRQQQQQQVSALFDGLEDFRKARTDFEEAKAKYEKEFAEYLAFHQKKKDGGGSGGAAERPAEGPRSGDGPPAERQGPPGQRPAGRGNRGGEPPRHADDGAEEATAAQDPPKQDPPKQDPAKQDPPAGGTAPAAAPAEKKDDAPKRPTYPKAPAPDPQREALLKVVDGELPLRVEAHRPDEIRAALRLQAEHKLPLLVLEFAPGAAAVAAEIAKAGVPVIVSDCLPVPLDPPYDAFDVWRLPAALHQAGASFAIASGRALHAPLLPLFAAAAVGGGLPAEQALRAITLTPAEILGIAQDTGSLQAGRYADVLVTDRPLFASDSRALLVLGKGRIEYEVQ